MPHAHAHVDKHIFTYRVIKDLGDYLPAVKKGITFDFGVGVSSLRNGVYGRGA